MKYDVKQTYFNSTLMSSVKGAYEFYHKKPIDDVLLFGLSGHAFVVNITKGIGPCAPYWWDMKPFSQMCKNTLGLMMFEDELSVTMKSPDDKKREVTEYIKSVLDKGNIVFMSSLEYQLIIGYELDSFILTSPWNEVPSVTKSIDFNTLEGMLDFMTVYTITPSKIGDIKDGVLQSLQYAKSLFENPSSIPEYAMGIKAYDYWLEQMTDESYNGHGNWWSCQVWAESRGYASEYMKRIQEYLDMNGVLDELSHKYKISSELFLQISEKESVSKEEKIKLIKELKNNELTIYELLKKLPI